MTTQDSTDPALQADLAGAVAALAAADDTARRAAETALLGAREASVEPLIAGLSVPAVASRAALFLGALSDRRAVGPLVHAASDAALDAKAHAAALRALGEVVDGRDAFDDSVTGALMAAARASDPVLRGYAVDAAARIGGFVHEDVLALLDGETDAFVRQRMPSADTEAAPTDSASSDVSFAELAAAAEAAGGALAPVLEALGARDPAARAAAQQALVDAGDEAVPHLLEKLGHADTRVRQGAAQALGALARPAAAMPLAMAADGSADNDFRALAYRALANCLTGAETGLADLVAPAARDADPFVRAGAMLCLGRLPDADVRALIVRGLFDNHDFVVDAAAVALSEGIRAEDAPLTPLLWAAHQKNQSMGRQGVQEALLIAFSRLDLSAPAWRVRVRQAVRADVFAASAAARKAAIVLLEGLYEAEGDPAPLSLIDRVLSRLSDADSQVRLVAASFLAAHLPAGMPGADAVLGEALAAADRSTGLVLVDALVRLGTTGAQTALRAASRHMDSTVALAAAEAADALKPGPAWVFKAEPVPPRPAEATRAAGPDAAPVQPAKPRRVRAVTAADGPAEAVTPSFDMVTPTFDLPNTPAKAANTGAAEVPPGGPVVAAVFAPADDTADEGAR